MDNEIHLKKIMQKFTLPAQWCISKCVQDHPCPGNATLSILYLVKDTWTKPQTQNSLGKEYQNSLFKKHFLYWIINVGIIAENTKI